MSAAHDPTFIRSLLALLRAALQNKLEGTRADLSVLSVPASLHGIDAFLLRALADANVALSKDLARAWKQRTAIYQLWSETLQSTQDEILDAFEKQRIPTMILKGSSLAQRLYPELWMRPSTDLDLLVLPEYRKQARATLRSLGFEPDSSVEGQWLDEHHHHEAVFTRSDAPPVELHTALFRNFGASIPSAWFFENATLRNGLLVPPPEREVLYLLAHAAIHRFERLLWLLDVALLLQQNPFVSSESIEQEAHGVHLHTAYAFATRHVSALTDRLDVVPMNPATLHTATMLEKTLLGRPIERGYTAAAFALYHTVLSDGVLGKPQTLWSFARGTAQRRWARWLQTLQHR